MDHTRRDSASAGASYAAVDHANHRAGETRYCSYHHGTGDDRLHYVAAGRGPIVVFVHGFPSFWYCWIRQMEALRDRFQVIAIDAQGAGASARPEYHGAWRVERLAAQLQQLLGELARGGQVLLVGHDWGAALSLALAQSDPQHLAGVIGIAAPPYAQFMDMLRSDPEQRERSDYMVRLRDLTLARIEDEGLAPLIAHGAYAELVEKGHITGEEARLFSAAVGDPAALWGGASWYRENTPPFDAVGNYRGWPDPARALNLPALLIWGEADRVFVESTPDRFAVANPAAQVLRLPGVGHWAMLESAEPVTAALGKLAHRVFGAQNSL